MQSPQQWLPRLIAFLCLGLAACGRPDGYSEELLVQGAIDDHALVHFEAAAAVPLGTRHAGTFNAALLSLVRQRGVQQLELSLTQGRWAWEQQVQPAAALPKPPGLELKVTFDGAVADTQAAYAALTQGLGGLLCTSVAMAPQLAVMAAPRVGWFSHQAPAVAAAASPATDEQRQAQQLRQQVYAWLPQVSVCSENLAAWRRLLPCREQAGLAASFHPLQLAAAPYYSLGLRLQVAPAPGGAAAGGSCSSADCGGAWLELRQVLTAALPRPNQQTQPASLFEAVFGGPPPPPCPAATSSTVYVARPATAVLPSLEGGGSSLHDTPAGQLVAWDARQQQEQLPASLLGSSSSSSEGGTFTAQQRPLQVVQHAVQHSSQAGTLVVGVRVSGAALAQQESGSALLHVMQLLPWQLLVDAASFEVKLDGQVLRAPGSPELVWQAVDARPDRTAVVELLLRLPSISTGAGSSDDGDGRQGRAWHELVLSIGYRPAFLGVFDHAPDASRGVDVPPAVATLLPPSCAGATLGQLATSSGHLDSSAAQHGREAKPAAAPPLLQRLAGRAACAPWQQYSGPGGSTTVPLPIPDFSMPFNVICFTSTLLAVLLGGVSNVVLRSPEELAGGGAAGGGAPAWKRKLRRVVALLLLMGVLAVYLDRDLQRQVDAWLHHWVLGRHAAPEQHGEL